MIAVAGLRRTFFFSPALDILSNSESIPKVSERVSSRQCELSRGDGLACES